MSRQSILETAEERLVTTAQAERVIAEAERRAAQRRFAAFQRQEVSAMLIAARATLGRRRGGLGAHSWMALAGVAIELEYDIAERLRADRRRSAREDGAT